MCSEKKLGADGPYVALCGRLVKLQHMDVWKRLTPPSSAARWLAVELGSRQRPRLMARPNLACLLFRFFYRNAVVF